MLQTTNVITSYASAPFLLDLLHKYKELELEVIVGVAKHNPINIWTHIEFKKMVEKFENLAIKYFVDKGLYIQKYITGIRHWICQS